MGASNTKQVEDKAALSKVVDHPVQTSTVSTGFHVIEIHMPSVGLGWLSILFLLLGVLALFAIWKRFFQRRAPRRHTLSPWDTGFPHDVEAFARDRTYPLPRYGHPRFDTDRFSEMPTQPPSLFFPGPAPLTGTTVPTQPQNQVPPAVRAPSDTAAC